MIEYITRLIIIHRIQIYLCFMTHNIEYFPVEELGEIARR